MMKKTLMRSGFNGQIMVIVLIILMVLTVIVIVAVRSTTRDITEQVQSRQYEQYYTTAERQMLLLQETIKNSAIEDAYLAIDTNFNGSPIDIDACSHSGMQSTCTYSPIELPDETGSGAIGDTVNIKTVIEDSTTIDDFTMQKDQSILLTAANNGDWVNVSNYPLDGDVGWIFTVDYLDPATGNYHSTKTIYNYASVFDAAYNNPTTGCRLNLTGSPDHDLPTDMTVTIIGCAGYQPLYFRIKPVMRNGKSTTVVSIRTSSSSTPLMRKITTVATSTATSDTTGVANPAVVLETKYLLISSPLELFDYVLRSEQEVVK
jgi:hypothetical protein